MRAFLLLLSLLLPSLALAAGPVTAHVEHAVHPVLIGREWSEIGKLVVEIPKGESSELTSITISLAGTTNLADLESVGVFRGSAKAFEPKEPFGEPASPAERVRIAGQAKLAAGANVFWLACRLKSEASLDDRVRATCTELDTSAGRIVPDDDAKFAGNRIGVALRQAGEGGVHTSRIPVLATTPAGTLLCVYDLRHRSSKDLQEDIDVGLSRSTDGGQTWEPARVIMDLGEYGGLPQEQNGVGDPGLLVDRETGEIFCFALWVHAKPGTHQWRGKGSEPGFEIDRTGQFMLTRSTDDGKTWSPLENLTRAIKREEWILLAPSPQQGIQLRDGTLVMPVQGRDDDGAFAALLISTDHGKSWRVSNRAHSGGNECQAAELADGSIMLNIRNGDKKRRAVVVTRDLGETWTKHLTHEQALLEPTCNGSLYRWVNESEPGTPALLLFANPQNEKARTHHTIQTSLDEGKSWSARLLLDEGRGFGYPSISRVDDEHVGIVYEGSQSHLMFERLRREELTPASP